MGLSAGSDQARPEVPEKMPLRFILSSSGLGENRNASASSTLPPFTRSTRDWLNVCIPSEREAWIGRLAAATLQTLDVFTRQGFAAFRPRFSALMEGRGRAVDVVDNGAVVVSGRLGDVDGHGRLLIEVGGGPPRTVSVGDVVFRDSPP